eukprot:PhM_4_TR14616/c4_g1_i1/m.84436
MGVSDQPVDDLRNDRVGAEPVHRFCVRMARVPAAVEVLVVAEDASASVPNGAQAYAVQVVGVGQVRGHTLDAHHGGLVHRALHLAPHAGPAVGMSVAGLEELTDDDEDQVHAGTARELLVRASALVHTHTTRRVVAAVVRVPVALGAAVRLAVALARKLVAHALRAVVVRGPPALGVGLAVALLAVLDAVRLVAVLRVLGGLPLALVVEGTRDLVAAVLAALVLLARRGLGVPAADLVGLAAGLGLLHVARRLKVPLAVRRGLGAETAEFADLRDTGMGDPVVPVACFPPVMVLVLIAAAVVRLKIVPLTVPAALTGRTDGEHRTLAGVGLTLRTVHPTVLPLVGSIGGTYPGVIAEGVGHEIDYVR